MRTSVTVLRDRGDEHCAARARSCPCGPGGTRIWPWGPEAEGTSLPSPPPCAQQSGDEAGVLHPEERSERQTLNQRSGPGEGVGGSSVGWARRRGQAGHLRGRS